MPVSRTNSPVSSDLILVLDRGNGIALHRQIEGALRGQIRSGRLATGAALPSTRTLARDLGVSRGVAVEAYAQLVAEGYLTSRGGGYTRVAERPASSDEGASPRGPSRPAPGSGIDFGYGRTNVAAFPRSAWLRSVRRVLAEAPDERLGYPDGQGVPELRTALSEYLNRARGTSARPENVVITNGFAQGIAVLLSVLAARGARRVAVEDPSADDDVRPLAAALGLEVVGVPVARDGLRTEALDRLSADALVVTPSHQWPTGGVLSAEARAAVLAWAERTGALIVEDDYDAEYRYDRAPIGAMHGLAPSHVVYAGTASKTLAPGFRLGWFVLPPRLREAFAAAKILADRGSPVLDQLTFADFLSHGAFDRHLRRMRPVYRRRRDALIAALGEHLSELQPAGIAAGLHLVAWLPAGLEEAQVVAAAAARGVTVAGLAPYRLAPSAQGGLIFGYSDLTEPVIRHGVERLADAVAQLHRP